MLVIFGRFLLRTTVSAGGPYARSVLFFRFFVGATVCTALVYSCRAHWLSTAEIGNFVVGREGGGGLLSYMLVRSK